eukprot:3114118-Alexandrium_andersonii.AAC.1
MERGSLETGSPDGCPNVYRTAPGKDGENRHLNHIHRQCPRIPDCPRCVARLPSTARGNCSGTRALLQ